MTDYLIRVRNAALQRVAEADDVQAAEARLRFNAIGTWTLSLPWATDPADALIADGAGIVIEDDVGTLVSGPRTTYERKRDRNGDRLVCYGVDDLVWLGRRLAHPSPADGDPATQAYDVRSGIAETVMRAYVDANAGPGALVDRRVPALELAADEARGLAVDGRARFDNLLDLVRKLAIAGGGLGFRLVQPPAEEVLRFEVYEPRDLTALAVFDEDLGNLASLGYKLNAPEATYLYVLGGGEGDLRTVVEGGDAAAIAAWGRIEASTDRRDTSNVAELEQARDVALVERGPRTELALDPVDTAALAYRVDYDLGDIVSVDVDDVRIEEVMREVRVQLTTAGVVVTPEVGGAGERMLLRAFEEIRELRRRVGSLERST